MLKLGRKKVFVDRVPNKAWSAEELVRLGLEHGVNFGDGKPSTYVLKPVAELIKILWEQVEFKEVQDPVEAVRGRKAPDTSSLVQAQERQIRARVTYRGIGWIQIPYNGRSQIFIYGMPVFIKQEDREFATQLMQRPQGDFEVIWSEIEDVDPLVSQIRQMKDPHYDDHDDDGLTWLDIQAKVF